MPVQQQTIACSARPSATSRAAASLAQAQSSRSSSARAPVRERLVAALAELLEERLGDAHAFVGGDGDLHARGLVLLPARELAAGELLQGRDVLG